MKLLTQEIKKQLPPIGTQDQEKDPMVYVKFFCPWSHWTWYAYEGQPVLDDSGSEIDFQFFGLVDGFEKELGYFNLSELESVKGPMGLPIERDLHWTPKVLEEIVPEMFRKEGHQ